MSELTKQAAEILTPTLATKAAYGSSGVGLFVAGLTINEYVGVAVGIASMITIVWTAIYNVRHKKKAMELIDAQIMNERRISGERGIIK